MGLCVVVDPHVVGIEEVAVQPRLRGVATPEVLLRSLHHLPDLYNTSNISVGVWKEGEREIGGNTTNTKLEGSQLQYC